MKLFLIFYTLLSFAEDNNNGWSLNEKLYENSLFNIVGNNLDILSPSASPLYRWTLPHPTY